MPGPRSYAANALNDLATVTQASQSRSFLYTSIKRLKSVTSPESGMTSYTYDYNGNLITRKDATGVYGRARRQATPLVIPCRIKSRPVSFRSL
jgi:YD repeat-containing protein